MFKLIALAILVVLLLLLFHFRKRVKTFYIDHRELFRQRWSNSQYFRVGDGSFEQDVRSGFSSNTFNLQTNVDDVSDTRAGLSESAKTAIKHLMDSKGLTFDAARLEYTKARMNDNDIDAEGVPRDPKLVRFD